MSLLDDSRALAGFGVLLTSLGALLTALHHPGWLVLSLLGLGVLVSAMRGASARSWLDALNGDSTPVDPGSGAPGV